MIKKNIKTLDQVQNPPKDFARWRLHLEDGDFIDVSGSMEERNTMIRSLVSAGRLHYGNINPINIDDRRLGLTERMPITEMPGNEESIKDLLKEDFGDWSWKVFALMSFLSIGLGTTVSIIRFIFAGPIVLSTVPTLKTLPLTTDILYTIGLVSAITICSWILQRGWRLLAYISCWIKLTLLLIAVVLIMFTVNIISEKIADKILNFLADNVLTKKEIRILALTIT